MIKEKRDPSKQSIMTRSENGNTRGKMIDGRVHKVERATVTSEI